MRRILVFPLLLLLVPVVSAQQSSSYKLTEHTFNAGGNPADGVVLASTSYKITLDAIGDSVAARDLSSTSYRMDGGFVLGFPPPGEVQDLYFTDQQTLVWEPEKSIGDYNLYRNLISNVLGLGYGQCQQENLTDETTTDGDPVPGGDGFFYLVTAENRLDEEGPKGTDSDGTPRQGELVPVMQGGGTTMCARITKMIPAVCLLLGLAVTLQAATPPARVNYQGVLRSASDVPENGDRDMVFRFYDVDGGAPPCPAGGGDLILTDSHEATGTGAVTVTGGLFNVELGGGSVADGTGPGIYTSVAEVFRDHANVYLEVVVGGETLCPRIPVISAGYALNADHLDGKHASAFIDTSGTAQTKYGKLVIDGILSPDYGIEAYGPSAGGYFKDSDGSGFAELGKADFGISAQGNQAGGYFRDLDGDAVAYLGFDNKGIEAKGLVSGGYFWDLDGSGQAYVGFGDRGIEAYGNETGGYFEDLDGSGYAYVGFENLGIIGAGNNMGGYFEDLDDSGYADLGWGDLGIYASGNEAGGWFADLDGSGTAYVGYGDRGIEAYGNEGGGYFEDLDGSSYAYVGGNFGWGIHGYGGVLGGSFTDLDSSGWAHVGFSSNKISGTGAVSFVQNHPEDAGSVIVYAAPEGDEVATYTRGTARMAGGEARVPLGATFEWVTNPDIGLTAYLTPRGEWADLYVESITTTELVVRGRNGSTPDAAFDYIVYGLRIGFEEASVVQEKTRESYIPSMKDHRDLYERRAELRQFNALERFKGMPVQNAALSLDRAVALKAAIQEYDPVVHGPVDPGPGRGRRPAPGEALQAPTVKAGDREAECTLPETSAPIVVAEPPSTPVEPEDPKPIPATASLFPVGEAVEPGDLLVLDPLRPGQLRRADTAADPTVVGIVAAEPFEVEGALQAAVLGSGFARVKADASHRVILAGDLLMASPTPGHAMVAVAPPPGAVIGKALEPLEAGTGLIKVLVMLR